MPRMNILNTVEREAFNSPPVFSSFQRKQYFNFPSTPIRRWPPQSGPSGPSMVSGPSTCREAFLDAVAHGSAVAWQHLDLLGEYDFSDEKLRDSIGIRFWCKLERLGFRR